MDCLFREGLAVEKRRKNEGRLGPFARNFAPEKPVVGRVLSIPATITGLRGSRQKMLVHAKETA